MSEKVTKEMKFDCGVTLTREMRAINQYVHDHKEVMPQREIIKCGERINKLLEVATVCDLDLDGFVTREVAMIATTWRLAGLDSSIFKVK
jgi:hypothetical protein